jgi:hypothetical protein
VDEDELSFMQSLRTEKKSFGVHCFVYANQRVILSFLITQNEKATTPSLKFSHANFSFIFKLIPKTNPHLKLKNPPF